MEARSDPPVASSWRDPLPEHPNVEVPSADRSPRIPSVKGKERADIHTTTMTDTENGHAAAQEAGADISGTDDGEEMDELDYERERQRRIEENRLLLDSLGFSALQPSASSSSLVPRIDQTGSPRKKRQKVSAPVYDRSGHVLSLPRPGEIHVMTCVEIPSDRRLKKRIADGEYADCTYWAEGEARRWKYGWGKGGEGEGEEEYEGEISKRFRWRKWKGLEKELRRELTRRGEMNDADQEGQEDAAVAGPSQGAQRVEGEPSAYSLIPGLACHQCRRKSEKPKMTCRNLSPLCRAVFCETCCKRYSYFDFDPDARTFICPLCKDCCNCSNCIRKRNLSHLLDGRKGVNRRLLQAGSKGESGVVTIQDALEKAVEGKIGLPPFDLVRIVTQAEDVISPDLPEEVIEVVAKKPTGKKTKKKREMIEGEPRQKRGRPRLAETQLEASNDGLDTVNPKLLFLKIRLPKPNAESNRIRPRCVKEVDSDGDTVGGYSSDDAKSSLTSLSSRGSIFSGRRLPFPPRPLGLPPPAITTNDYLSSLARTDHLLSYEDNDVSYPFFHYSPLQPSSTGNYGMDHVNSDPQRDIAVQPNLLHSDPTVPRRSKVSDPLDDPMPSTIALQPSTSRIRLRLPQQQHHQPTPQYANAFSPNSTFLPELPDLTLPTLSSSYNDSLPHVPDPSSSNSTTRQDHRSHLSPIEGFSSLSDSALAYSPTTPALEYSQNGTPYETTSYPWTVPGLHDPPPYSHSPPSRIGCPTYRTLPVSEEMSSFTSRATLSGSSVAPAIVAPPLSFASSMTPSNILTSPDNTVTTNKAMVSAFEPPSAGMSTNVNMTMKRSATEQSEVEDRHQIASTTMGENKLGLKSWNNGIVHGRHPNGGSTPSVSGLVDRRYHPDHL